MSETGDIWSEAEVRELSVAFPFPPLRSFRCGNDEHDRCDGGFGEREHPGWSWWSEPKSREGGCDCDCHRTEVRYVSPNGDDSADGLSWERAKRTIIAAYDALPRSGGEIWFRTELEAAARGE